MDRDAFEHLRFDTPATLLCAIEQDGRLQEGHYDFGRLCDALSFAVATLPARARKTAWIVVDDGLLAPEDLPKLFDRLAAWTPARCRHNERQWRPNRSTIPNRPSAATPVIVIQYGLPRTG